MPFHMPAALRLVGVLGFAAFQYFDLLKQCHFLYPVKGDIQCFRTVPSDCILLNEIGNQGHRAMAAHRQLHNGR